MSFPTLGKERFAALKAAVEKRKREGDFDNFDDDCPICRGVPLSPDYLAQLQYEVEHELMTDDVYEWLDGLARRDQTD